MKIKLDIARAALGAARHKDSELADWARKYGSLLIAEIEVWRELSDIQTQELQEDLEASQADKARMVVVERQFFDLDRKEIED